MIGITIGIGQEWNAVSKRAAARMSELTGLDCHIISFDDYSFENPVWLKCKIIEMFPNEDSFLYFDADIWCLKQWNPVSLFEAHNRDFLGVAEPQHNAIHSECEKHGIVYGDYINAGLMIFGKEHRPVFDHALLLHPFGRWYDQTPINIALKNSDCFSILPSKYNALAHGGKYPQMNLDEVVNIHWCSCNSANRIKELQTL